MKLAETPFKDLLPSSVRDDHAFSAAAAALDEDHAKIQALIPNVLVWSRIDELEEPLLSTLAWQLHLDAYEGWPLAQTLEQKRGLVKNAIILHYFKGTRYSLERIFDLLDMRGQIVEWWESGETAEEFPPYTFDIEIDVQRPINEKLYVNLDKLIDALKNVRSHRRKIKLNWGFKPGRIIVGAQALMGAELTLYPLLPRDIDISANVPHIAAYQRTNVELNFAPPDVPETMDVPPWRPPGSQ